MLAKHHKKNMAKLIKIEKADTLHWKTDDDNNLKCGEIVLSNNIQFSFSCIFCHQICYKVQEFFRHVLYDHLNYLEEYQFSDDEEYLVQKIVKPEATRVIDDAELIDLKEECTLVETNNYGKHFENFISDASCNSYIKSEIDDSEEAKSESHHDSDTHSQAMSCYSPAPQTRLQDILHIEILEENSTPNFGLESTETHSNEPYSDDDQDDNSASNFELANTITHKEIDSDDYQDDFEQSDESQEKEPDYGEETVPTKENDHSCPQCKKTFVTKTGLNRHIGNVHKASAVKLTCIKCSKVFRSAIQLDLHMKRHMGIKPHTCELCGSCFSDKSNLNVHVLRHKGIKPHKCTLCEKSFHSTTELKLHMRSHTGERPFVCEVCGRKFSNSGHLCSHRRRHLGEKRFKCDHCEKRFFDRKLLNDHKVIHTDDRPFACDLCGSTFQRKKALLQHQKLHSSVKQYVCKLCGKSFAQNAGLYSHMKYH